MSDLTAETVTRTGTFQYVRHGDVDAFHRRGWMIAADLGPTHGAWSVLMWHASFPDCEICRHEN